MRPIYVVNNFGQFNHLIHRALRDLEIDVELIDGSLLDSYQKLQELNERMRHNLRTILSIDAKINLVSPRTLKRFEGKAKRVTDLR